MDTIYLELVKIGATVGLVVAIWKMHERQIAQTFAEIKESVKNKADASSMANIEVRLTKSIDKIEERQSREIDALRSEMSKLTLRIDDLRKHLDGRFESLLHIMQSTK